MTIPDWLSTSAISTAAILLMGWLGRKYLSEWVSASVRHDFDTRLEGVRAELRAKESQISALRDGALTNMAALQTSAAQRRLKATDDLWQAVTEWGTLTGVVSSMSVINFDVASSRIESDTKLQQFFEMTGKDVPEHVNFGASAESARPYLSDLAWALYTAYRTVFHTAVFKATLLKNGIDGRKFFNEKGLDELMLKALPDYKDYITQWGHKGHHALIDLLRERILAELRLTIEGKQQDREGVKRAAEIIKLADTVLQGIDKKESGTPELPAGDTALSPPAAPR